MITGILQHNCPVGALGHGDVIEGEEPRWAGFSDPSQTVFRFRISPEGHYFLSAYDDNKNWPASDGSELRPIYQGGPALRYDLDSSLGCPFLSANFSPGHFQELIVLLKVSNIESIMERSCRRLFSCSYIQG